MHRMKVRGAGVVALLAVATLATGCAASSGTAESSDGEDESGGTVLTVATDSDQMYRIADDFEAANPGVTVKLTVVSTADPYYQQMRTQLAAGTAPDVLRVWPGSGTAFSSTLLGDEGQIMDLSDQPWADDVESALAPIVSSSDGVLVSQPITVVGIGAIYNDSAMDEAGLSAPTTYSEVLDFCAAAKAKGKVAYALGAKDQWVTQMVPYVLTATTVYGEDPDFVTKQLAGEATFANSAWVDALDQYQEMEASGCFNDGPTGTSYDQTVTMVGTGEALAVVQTTAALQAIQAAAPEGTTFSLAALPATDDPDDTGMPVSYGNAYAINSAAEQPELAKRFLEFMTSSQEMAKIAEIFSSAPAFSTDDFERDGVTGPLLEYKESGHSSVFPDQQWPSAKVQSTMLANLQELLNGTMTSEQVLESVDQVFADAAASSD